MSGYKFDSIFDQAVEEGIDCLNEYLDWFFEGLRTFFDLLFDGLTYALSIPYYFFIPIVGLLAWRVSGLSLAIFAVISLTLCQTSGMWSLMVSTLALVLTATLLALLVAVPLGIFAGLWRSIRVIVSPIMDTLQTLPPYVYLLPAIALLGYGGASAVVATMILAIPPAVRLTMLGMQQIPNDRIELARSLGATWYDDMFRIRIPSALPSIMAGVNQTLMVSLGMAVIAGIIGAGGLGGEVYRAVRYLEVGRAMDAGLTIVVLSILLDRISEGTVRSIRRRQVAHG